MKSNDVPVELPDAVVSAIREYGSGVWWATHHDGRKSIGDGFGSVGIGRDYDEALSLLVDHRRLRLEAAARADAKAAESRIRAFDVFSWCVVGAAVIAALTFVVRSILKVLG